MQWAFNRRCGIGRWACFTAEVLALVFVVSAILALSCFSFECRDGDVSVRPCCWVVFENFVVDVAPCNMELQKEMIRSQSLFLVMRLKVSSHQFCSMIERTRGRQERMSIDVVTGA